MGSKQIVFSLVGIVGASLIGSAHGGYVEIGGGWAAEWDDSLDPFVDIVSNGVVDGAVFIQKAAEFTQGPVGGVFPSIPIVFRQIAYGAVSHIVIDDEIIVNSTGEHWRDFHMQLVNGDDAFFNPERTLASGGGGPIGWSIAPFTAAEFSDDLRTLWISEGDGIDDGALWFPGNGADDGQLWIDVNPRLEGEGGFTIFTLKETPTPAPGALALLALGGLLGTRRRRG